MTRIFTGESHYLMIVASRFDIDDHDRVYAGPDGLEEYARLAISDVYMPWIVKYGKPMLIEARSSIQDFATYEIAAKLFIPHPMRFATPEVVTGCLSAAVRRATREEDSSRELLTFVQAVIEHSRPRELSTTDPSIVAPLLASDADGVRKLGMRLASRLKSDEHR